MVNIIKHGSYEKFKHYDCICPLCGCTFTCEEEDLITIDEGPKVDKDSEEVPAWFVQELRCPDCKYTLEEFDSVEVYDVYEYGTNKLLREERREHV